MASVEAGYLGDSFGRPFGEPLPWFAHDAEPNADMWATADESREQIVALYRRVWAHSDATIEALDLDAPAARCRGGRRSVAEVTLHQILVHMIAETNRHAGHADIVRELIDGAVGSASRQRQHAAGRYDVVGGLPQPAGAGSTGGRSALSQPPLFAPSTRTARRGSRVPQR